MADSKQFKIVPAANTPTKTSYGIILCRINPDSRRVETCMVRKRYTYAFSNFMFGRYKSSNNGLQKMLDQMTAEELSEIWSLDFDRLWYRIWLNTIQNAFYNKMKSKFQTQFLRDKGASLKQLLKQSKGTGTDLWEIPKGKKTNTLESDINCAIRELQEETNIGKTCYRIIPTIKKETTFMSMGIKYVNIYFVAVAYPWISKQDLNHVRHTGLLEQKGEIHSVRWMDIEHVRLIDTKKKHNEALLAPVFRFVKKNHCDKLS